MNGPVAVTRLFPTIDNMNARKCVNKLRHESVLLGDIAHNNTTPGDILNLRQANVFAPQLLYD